MHSVCFCFCKVTDSVANCFCFFVVFVFVGLTILIIDSSCFKREFEKFALMPIGVVKKFERLMCEVEFWEVF